MNSRLVGFYQPNGFLFTPAFARQDLWKSDMSKYDNVVIFGVEQMMAQLEEKLEKELKGGSTVVACRSRHQL